MGDLRVLPVAREGNEGVVEALKEMLAIAERGELRAVVVAGHWDRPGDPNCTVIRWGTAPDGSNSILVTACERAKLVLCGVTVSSAGDPTTG